VADDIVRRGNSGPSWGADRVPPHNLDAEKSLLGAMLLNTEATGTGLERIKPDDFYRQAHQRIFDAIGHLYSRGEPCDVVTVASRLEATGELEQVGGKTYLLDIVNTVPLAGNVGQYADIVKRMSLLRRLIIAATRIAAICYEAPDDVDEVIENAEPPAVSEDGTASVVLVEPTMVSGSYCHMPSLIVPVCRLMVADAPVNGITPKFASGNVPPDHGASTIHSAEERLAAPDF